MPKNPSDNEPGVDWDLKELEDAFACEFVEPPCSSAEEFRDYVMNNQFEQDEVGPDDF